MADTAAQLVDRVLPNVPYRQWVLSLPRQARFLLARDVDLLGQVVGVFLHKVFAWQRRRARKHGIADPRCGAVTFVQRFGSLLNLNCHAHALIPDGVFAASPGGSVLFRPLPPPWDDDVAKLLDQIARAIHRLVSRRLAEYGDDATPCTPIASSTKPIAKGSNACVAMVPDRRSPTRGSRSIRVDTSSFRSSVPCTTAEPSSRSPPSTSCVALPRSLRHRAPI